MSLSFAQSQSAEGFPDLAVTSRAMDRNERADRMGAELLRKGDFFLRREARACKIRRAEPLHQLRGQKFHQRPPIILRGVHDLHQGRPAP